MSALYNSLYLIYEPIKKFFMKNIMLMLMAVFIIYSCEQETVEVSKSAGEWMMQNSPNQGKKYVMGSDNDADLVKEFMDAYENMNAEKMVEMSADIVKFHPGDVSGVFDVDMTNTDFINERQKDWDSIERTYVFIMPINMEDTLVRFVETSFNETTFSKDGTSESKGVFERLYINEKNKIERVVQWHRPSNQ